VIIIFKAQIVKLYTIVEIAWRVFGVRWVPIKGLPFFTSLTFLKLHSLTHILSGKFSILFCNGRRGGGTSICPEAKVAGIDREYRGQWWLHSSRCGQGYSCSFCPQGFEVHHSSLNQLGSCIRSSTLSMPSLWSLDDRSCYLDHWTGFLSFLIKIHLYSLARIKNLLHILERKGKTYKYTRYQREVLKNGWEFKSEH